jgi:hypothetical protein
VAESLKTTGKMNVTIEKIYIKKLRMIEKMNMVIDKTNV